MRTRSLVTTICLYFKVKLSPFAPFLRVIKVRRDLRKYFYLRECVYICIFVYILKRIYLYVCMCASVLKNALPLARSSKKINSRGSKSLEQYIAIGMLYSLSGGLGKHFKLTCGSHTVDLGIYFLMQIYT